MPNRGFVLRSARCEDAPLVRKVMAGAFGDNPKEVWSTSDLSEAFHRGDSVVVEKKGELIGYCLVRAIVDEAEILSIAIIPEERGAGIASRLLAETLIRLRNKLVLNVYLEVRENNKHAKNLYLKSGFVSIGKRAGYYTSENAGTENAIMYKHTIRSKID